ncbi:cold shock domain-containing protein [Burkholderiaceae bacterium UC74_6]
MSDAQRFEGQLVMWNGERGFGAIVPRQGGQELFVHVSAFPRDGAPPAVNELVSFEIVSDGEGRKRAARINRLKKRAGSDEEVKRVLSPSGGALAMRRRREERRRRIALAAVGFALAVAALGWMQFAKVGTEPNQQRYAGAATPAR